MIPTPEIQDAHETAQALNEVERRLIGEYHAGYRKLCMYCQCDMPNSDKHGTKGTSHGFCIPPCEKMPAFDRELYRKMLEQEAA